MLKSASLWHWRLQLENQALPDWKDKSESIDHLEKHPGQYQQASYQQSPYQPETGVLELGQTQGEWPMRALKVLQQA